MSPLTGNHAEGGHEGMSSATAPAIYAECVSPYLEGMRRERAQFHQTVVERLADSSYQAAYDVKSGDTHKPPISCNLM